MGPHKALWSGGFHAIFYQKFWHIVGPLVIKMCLDILNGGQSIALLNSTYVILIPKKKNPQTMADFRPISLCNVVYKLVTKIQANRLKLVLPHAISLSQSAFVLGTQIFDNVIVAFELLHSLQGKNNGTKGFMALKLDINKAYDKVE